jgi:putative ABC transport system permease protein
MRQGMILTLIGLAIGVALTLGITRVVANLLVNVSADDPLVFLAGSFFLAAVALAANYLPARRATRIDPQTTRSAVNSAARGQPSCRPSGKRA